MIVTRNWLEEYIDLSGISNSELSAKLNSIGLEVDSIKNIDIPKNVVVGKIVSCKKHPNANKLNYCQVDIGEEILDIVCGASNVKEAQFVAVAKIGAILPENFEIKKATLRGVDSYGMICSSSELGLPMIEDGIMILDDSIGELEVGKELREYKSLNDTIIDIELTANRGDCLSVYGIARDLGAAFKKELKKVEDISQNYNSIAIAKEIVVEFKDDLTALLKYKIAKLEELKLPLLYKLRLAIAEIEVDNNFEKVASYATHSSGVIIRGYDFDKLYKENNSKVELEISKDKNNLVVLKNGNNILSIIGVWQEDEFKANSKSSKVLIEASYIDPYIVIEGISNKRIKSDRFYNNSSKGSEPDVDFGIIYLKKVLNNSAKCSFSQGSIKVGQEPNRKNLSIDINKINAIIGKKINKSDIINILKLLYFEVSKIDESIYKITIPSFRHDISNVYDIAEEVMRIYGIDNINSKPLIVVEKNRINSTYLGFRRKEAFLNRAISAGFFNAITYIFTNKEYLLKYRCEVVKDELDIINPIVKELNTLRTTTIINLLEAVSKNIKYGKKRVALFEIGVVFNKDREEKEVIGFIFSGEDDRASVKNSAKAKNIDFISFVEKINSVIGDFELIADTVNNDLFHPYMSARVVKDNKDIGYIARIHPKVQKDFEIFDTFVAELNLEDILPKDKKAKALSNYQPTTKDLSIVVNKSLNFYKVAKALKEFKEKEKLLKDFYPLDIYSDKKLKDKKSLTIRFIIQSDYKTLNDKEIETIMNSILELLENRFGAVLR